jgi:hypothetical protein
MAKKPPVSIKFNIPPDMLNGFKDLTDKIQRHMVRQAVRSAILPARNGLKSKLMSLGMKSRTSSGASTASVVYGIVSVNKNYVEAYTREAPVIKQPGKFRQVSLGTLTGFNRRTGQLRFNRRFRLGEVRSTLRRNTQRRRADVTHAYKRWPKKYWHLSEYGFKRSRGSGMFAASNKPVSFAGHNFAEKVTAETREECVQIFEQRMRELFKQHFQVK